ncbi:MAG: hypothetical protein CM15mV142_300 [Caudoviricetes sp.]|nr:MAG: hypothetical protein CM15mV142_300 [Caudoviricetes sp.]
MTTTSSFGDVTGMFINITPKLPSSRILILFMINSIYGNLSNVGGSSNYHHFRIVKQVNNRTDNCNAMNGNIDAEIQNNIIRASILVVFIKYLIFQKHYGTYYKLK